MQYAVLGQWLRIGGAVGILVATGYVLVFTPLGQQLWALVLDPRPERLQRSFPEATIWIACAVVGLMVLHTLVPLPAELLAVAAGMALGPFWGTVTVWIGAMLGAYLGFFLARTFGQPFLRYVIASERIDRWLERLHHADASVLLAVRLLPIISFNLVNYTLGLSSISWWRFTWTTGSGIFPLTVCMVVFGAHLDDWRVLLLMLGAAVAVSVGGYLLVRRRQFMLPR